ncbi:hypothetical protein GA0061098_101296 [Bradyrhizobium shewense]|uniref:Uncharacterized protein n=1 Tax=Bradyrhizobium shewense TaxID=1761772 RepID=A0A1C3X525_9BRAD|nr:hypothetical protein GA0061098_101296 [Bradyrhizobium shewense]
MDPGAEAGHLSSTFKPIGEGRDVRFRPLSFASGPLTFPGIIGADSESPLLQRGGGR